MLGMLEMARLVSRRASTTSSMLVIKRSFTTTIRMALYCQWQHHSKVFAKSTCDFLFGFCDTWAHLEHYNQRGYHAAVHVRRDRGDVGASSRRSANDEELLGGANVNAHIFGTKWRTRKHSRGAPWNNARILQQEWFLRVQEKSIFCSFVWGWTDWFLHFLQELMFWSQLRVLHLRWLQLCSILNMLHRYFQTLWFHFARWVQLSNGSFSSKSVRKLHGHEQKCSLQDGTSSKGAKFFSSSFFWSIQLRFVHWVPWQ